MKFIELETWDRAMHYQVFRNSLQPQYCVTFDLDITHFLPKIKEKGYSFTFAFVYAVTKCANQIEEFRCRFVDGKPAIFETINTSFTYLKKGTELFKVVNVPMQNSMDQYVTLAKQTEENQTEFLQLPQWETIYTNFLHSRGYHIVIFHTRTLVKKIMLHLCLIGGNFMKKTKEYYYPFQYKYIILS